MRFYLITVGERNPDTLSTAIQEYLTARHGVPVNKSHAAILVEDAGKWSGVWESMGDGFKGPKDPVAALADSEIRDKILLNVSNPLQAIRWLREFLGTPYANMQYLLFAPMWLRVCSRYFMPRILLKLIRNGKMLSFCSESVAHFIRNNCFSNAGHDAFEDPGLSPERCDEIDPFLIVPIGEQYGKRC